MKGDFETNTTKAMDENQTPYKKEAGNISIVDWIKGAITFDYDALSKGREINSTLWYGLLFIITSMFFDFAGIEGFNFRFKHEINGQITPIYLIIQPIFLIYLSLVFSFISGYIGDDVSLKEAFSLFAASHIWTLVSILAFPLTLLLPPMIFLVFIVFGLFYVNTLVSGISDKEILDRLIISIVVFIILIIAMFAFFFIVAPILIG